MLRRYPILDVILSAMMFGWGLAAEFDPQTTVQHGMFYGHCGAARVVGGLSIVISVMQTVIALNPDQPRHSLRRAIVSGLGLWMLLTYTLAVTSAAGHIAWGGAAVEELLICLAVL